MSVGYDDLKAIFINGSLTRSPGISNTEGLIADGRVGGGGPENDFTNRNTTFMTWNLGREQPVRPRQPGVPVSTTDERNWTVEGGRARLSARFDAAHGATRGHALFAHCFTCGKDVRAAGEIARTLAARGIGVLRVDFTGLGGSGGDTADTSFSGDVEDLVRAADRMRDAGRAPQLLVGHSLGGAAVIAAAARIPEVRAVATIGAPLSPADVTGVLGPVRQTLLAGDREEVEIDLGGAGPFRLRREFLSDLAVAPQRRSLAALNVPLLVLHAPDDTVVDFGQARQIADTAGGQASVVALDGADHLLSRPPDAAWAAGMIASWASRFLAEDVEPDADRPEAGTVVVTANRRRPYGQDVDSDRLHWTADEPESAGGAGSGPDPYQLLLSALGACTAITLRMYADRAGLPLDAASVTLTHDRLHAKDCAECETATGRIDRIVREIRLDGDLDPDQRAKLIAIADRCPVHRTLTSEIVIETDEV